MTETDRRQLIKAWRLIRDHDPSPTMQDFARQQLTHLYRLCLQAEGPKPPAQQRELH